jgi:hypothetical protein
VTVKKRLPPTSQTPYPSFVLSDNPDGVLFMALFLAYSGAVQWVPGFDLIAHDPENGSGYQS